MQTTTACTSQGRAFSSAAAVGHTRPAPERQPSDAAAHTPARTSRFAVVGSKPFERAACPHRSPMVGPTALPTRPRSDQFGAFTGTLWRSSGGLTPRTQPSSTEARTTRGCSCSAGWEVRPHLRTRQRLDQGREVRPHLQPSATSSDEGREVRPHLQPNTSSRRAGREGRPHLQPSQRRSRSIAGREVRPHL